MLGMAPILLKFGEKLIDRFVPDPVERDKAKADLRRAEMDGEFRELELQASMIIAEAQSKDPWTSRARPSFLYVVYFYLVSAVPFGVLFMAFPARAKVAIDGVQLWFAAIPPEMWALFGAGYLGYTGARSYDKSRKLKSKALNGLWSGQ